MFRNYIGKLAVCCCIVMILSGCFLFQSREEATIKVDHTDLSSENINGIKLLLNINELKNVKSSEGSLDTTYYFDDDSIFIEVNSNQEILLIRAGANEINRGEYVTERGINKDSKIEEVIKAYGDNYYKILEQGMDIIGYVDKDNSQRIEFWHIEGKVEFVDYCVSNLDEIRE